MSTEQLVLYLGVYILLVNQGAIHSKVHLNMFADTALVCCCCALVKLLF